MHLCLSKQILKASPQPCNWRCFCPLRGLFVHMSVCVYTHFLQVFQLCLCCAYFIFFICISPWLSFNALWPPPHSWNSLFSVFSYMSFIVHLAYLLPFVLILIWPSFALWLYFSLCLISDFCKWSFSYYCLIIWFLFSNLIAGLFH